MLGTLADRLSLWAADRRLVIAGGLVLLAALGGLAFVRLPRPQDFAADLPAAHPVAQARATQRANALLALRIEPVAEDAVGPLVASLESAASGAGLSISTRVDAGGGSAQAILVARSVLDRASTLLPVLTLGPEAGLVESIRALGALPDRSRVAAVLSALAQVIERGKAAPVHRLANAVSQLVALPPDSRPTAVSHRLAGGALTVLLRGAPGAPAEGLRTAAAAVAEPARARGLNQTLTGYPLMLDRPAAPGWHVLAAGVPLVVAAGLAWALGVAPALSLVTGASAGALLALPLLLLLCLAAGLDPAATWALCASGGLLGALVLLFHGLALGQRESGAPVLRVTRAALRGSILGAGIFSALCALASMGTRWAAPAAAICLAGAALAALVLWAFVLPLTLVVPRLSSDSGGALLLSIGAWGSERRASLGLLLLVAGLGLTATVDQRAPLAPTVALLAGVPLAISVSTELVAESTRALAEVGAHVEGPPAPVDETNRRALEASAAIFLARVGPESAAVGPASTRPAVDPAVEDTLAMNAVLAELRLVPELVAAADALGQALGVGAPEAREMTRYLASGALRHALGRLRAEVRAAIDRGTATSPTSPFFSTPDGQALLIVLPEHDVVIPGLQSPLDTFATVRAAPQVGGASLLAGLLGLALLSLTGVVAAQRRFLLLPLAAMAGGLPVLRTHVLLGVPLSSLSTAAAWSGATCCALFAATVIRTRSGVLAPRGLRVAVATVLLGGLIVGSLVVRDTPFGPSAVAALVTSSLVMGVLYLTH